MLVRTRLLVFALASAVAACDGPPARTSGTGESPATRATPASLAASEPEPTAHGAHTAAPSVAAFAEPQPPPVPALVVCYDCGGRPFPLVPFPYGSAVVSAEAERKLDDAAETAKARTDIALVVEGHIDPSEGALAHGELARLRADAVKRLLVARGIDGARLRVVSYESSRPLDETPTGRAHNCRAQISVDGAASWPP